MSFLITDNCTNCGACEPECPNSAVYEGGFHWKFSEGTKLSGNETTIDGNIINADEKNEPLSDDTYFIVNDKCTDCLDYSFEPQCAAVCPMDAIQINLDETEIELRQKIKWLHKTDTPYQSCPTQYQYNQHKTCCHTSDGAKNIPKNEGIFNSVIKKIFRE